jgi:hypothetical protein
VGRVVSNFVVQALAGQPLTVFGDGKQTRSFCYVSDLVEGFVRLMARWRGARAVAEGGSGSAQPEYHASAGAAGRLGTEGAAGGRAGSFTPPPSRRVGWGPGTALSSFPSPEKMR